jgi:transcriptional regulator of acetoin/glycerol metabolism
VAAKMRRNAFFIRREPRQVALGAARQATENLDIDRVSPWRKIKRHGLVSRSKFRKC